MVRKSGGLNQCNDKSTNAWILLNISKSEDHIKKIYKICKLSINNMPHNSNFGLKINVVSRMLIYYYL